MSRNLWVGAAKVDITPAKSLPLAGFAHRRGVSAGISSPLCLRALVFEQESGNRRDRSLLVSADIIWWGPDRVARLQEQLAAAWGFEPAAIILTATHNHSAPQTTGAFGTALGEMDDGYVEFLEQQLTEAIRLAQVNLEPVELRQGKGACSFAVNRRLCVDGKMTMAPNPAGPVDREVSVIHFVTLYGRSKAVLVHFSCHATTTGDNLVSGEFPGVAMRSLEEQLDEGAVAVYLQGCAADVRPGLIRENAFYRGDESDVRTLAASLSAEVRKILGQPMTVLGDGELKCHHRSLFLDFAGPAPRESADKAGTALEITFFRLTRDFALMCFNSEMVTEYGLLVKRLYQRRVLPVAYTNGMIGYVTTEQQLAEGGYEAGEAFRYFAKAGPFAPGTERKIAAAIAEFGRWLK